MKDMIYRDDAVALVIKAIHGTDNKEIQNYLMDGLRKQMWSLPSAENSNAKTQNSNQETQNSNGDLIYRAYAKQQISEWATIITKPTLLDKDATMVVLDSLPSAEAVDVNEVTIHYKPYPSSEAVPHGRLIDADALYKKATDLWDKSDSEDFEKGIFKLILNAPTGSADAVQGWIPCSERLPDEKGEYLVTYHPCYWDDVRTDIRVGIDSFRGKTTWAKHKHQRVIAWMPLPTPYKGGEE